jgi:hypothetical protein
MFSLFLIFATADISEQKSLYLQNLKVLKQNAKFSFEELTPSMTKLKYNLIGRTSKDIYGVTGEIFLTTEKMKVSKDYTITVTLSCLMDLDVLKTHKPEEITFTQNVFEAYFYFDKTKMNGIVEWQNKMLEIFARKITDNNIDLNDYKFNFSK